MDPLIIEVVQKSYGRCLVKEKFFDKFYENFLASSDKIAPMFKNTDFKKQKELLKSSLNFVIMYAKNENSSFAKNKLAEVGEIHSHGKINVSPDLYPFWTDSLIKTIKEFDEKFSDETESMWRKVLSPAIEILKSKY